MGLKRTISFEGYGFRAISSRALFASRTREFCFEFITNFFPKAAVSARVFLSTPQVPLLLNSLSQSWQNYETKIQQQGQQPPQG